jgi:hypothetical protein
MLVLQMKKDYEVHSYDGLRWHDINTKFHEDWYRRSINVKGFPRQF